MAYHTSVAQHSEGAEQYGPFSSGSSSLDALVEELRAGDNVVLYTADEQDYLPFVESLLRHVKTSSVDLVYVRSEGSLDALTSSMDVSIWEMSELAAPGDPIGALQAKARQTEPGIYYLFEPLASYTRWLPRGTGVDALFLSICPLLFRLHSVAYWGLTRGSVDVLAVAAVKDCTQVFLKVERQNGDLLLTPIKVWSRYSEAMFQPHRVRLGDDGLRLQVLPPHMGDQESYTQALTDKSRELAEIRDALDISNRELVQRNRELLELNDRLAEQSRLYRSLRGNLDQLLKLLQVGHTIGATLAADQVRQAIVGAASRLFDAPYSRLHLRGSGSFEPVDVASGSPPDGAQHAHEPQTEALRARVCETQEAASLTLHRKDYVVSVAAAPIIARGGCLGTLEVHGHGDRLDTEETRTLLGYLASEGSMALDNALLYQEVEAQGLQLRSYVEDVIDSEEQESRRLAFDLHDGLVQIIVASYQHLQTAQAWRRRDPAAEEKELLQGVQLLRQAIYEARKLISQLRPAGLDDFGLVHALRLHIAQMAAETDWDTGLEVDPGWEDLPEALEAALFRIVQEATNNAQKYAEATKVRITLAVAPDELRIGVRDWGKGFVPAETGAAPQAGRQIGLIGIRERARLWGGRCEIHSVPGEGTLVEVHIPRSRIATAQKGLE